MKNRSKPRKRSIEEYAKCIEGVRAELFPKTNRKMVALGFITMAAGLSPIMLIMANSIITHQHIPTAYFVLFFFCFIIFFIGYMVVHKAVSCEWL